MSTRSRAIAKLPPPAGFSVLVEQLAGEMAASGIIPGSPMFEPFLQMQIGALVQRVRGICAEHSVDLAEEVKAVGLRSRRRGGNAGARQAFVCKCPLLREIKPEIT